MKIDVKHIAKLANLPLTEKEIPKFEKQLSEILTYVEQLKELDTKDTPPTAQVTGLSNITQEDTSTPKCLDQEVAISQAKKSHNGLFVVDAILESDD